MPPAEGLGEKQRLENDKDRTSSGRERERERERERGKWPFGKTSLFEMLLLLSQRQKRNVGNWMATCRESERVRERLSKCNSKGIDIHRKNLDNSKDRFENNLSLSLSLSEEVRSLSFSNRCFSPKPSAGGKERSPYYCNAVNY